MKSDPVSEVRGACRFSVGHRNRARVEKGHDVQLSFLGTGTIIATVKQPGPNTLDSDL